MKLDSVLHYMNESFTYKVDNHKYLIRLRTGKNAFKNIKVRYVDKYLRERNMPNHPTFTKEMIKVATNDMFDYYEINISDLFVYKKSQFSSLAYRYYFILEQDNELMYYGNYKFFKEEPTITIDMFSMVMHQLNNSYLEVPSWSKGAVFYQIFPERFYPTDGKYSDNWFTSDQDGQARTNGTLRGIIQKVDYLKELGVDAIYINPIFLANTSHRYDTVDYMKIDPLLGTEDDLKDLVDIYHKNNIKVILDLVFNHSGIYFFAFQDILKNQEKSKYKDWYMINSFPISVDPKSWPPKYQSFSYGFGMPKFNTDNEGCREYLLNVARHYLETFKVDGYRLDVADEVTHSFWKEFRKTCKSINKDCLIMGEVWYESTPYMRGDEWDSIMNYNFFDETRAFLQDKISMHEYINRLEMERGEMGQDYYHNSNILLGTHDTDRLYECLEGNKDKYKLAMSLLFFLPGAPIIYYGDEEMMYGEKGRNQRGGMIFDENYNQDIQTLVKRLIHLKHLEVLRTGELKIEELSEKVMKITRFNEEDEIHMIVALQDIKLDELENKINLIDESRCTKEVRKNQIIIYR